MSGCGFSFEPASDGKSTIVVKGHGDRVVGRLWQNKGERGPRFSGSLGRGTRIALWPNTRKEKDTHPDYRVSVEQERPKEDRPKALSRVPLPSVGDGGFGDDDIPF